MKFAPVPSASAQIARRRASIVGEVVGAFESETAAVILRTSPLVEHLVLYVLIGIIATSFLAMSVVKLERVVTGAGRIVAARGALYVSPFDTGIVKDVRVKAGDVVKKGEVLATLDPTFTSADVKQLRQKRRSDEAAVAREEAELAGKPYGPVDSDPYGKLQGEIYSKRQAEYRSNLENFAAQIRGAAAQVAQYSRDSELYSGRLKLAREVESTYRPLLEKGYVSKLQAMQAADTRTEVSRLLADAQSQIATLRQTMESLEGQRDAFVQKWHSDIAVQLVADRNDLGATVQLLEKAQKLSELTRLDSPADAVVLKVGRVSSGSVAASGANASGPSQDALFTLVPIDGAVEADVNVPADEIGFIKAGDPVRLKLHAYPYVRHGTALGTIKTISEGSFTTDDNNTPVPAYFKVRVSIKEARLRNVPTDFRLIPGMTLASDILVGRRTILSYLTESALRTGSEAMREP